MTEPLFFVFVFSTCSSLDNLPLWLRFRIGSRKTFTVKSSFLPVPFLRTNIVSYYCPTFLLSRLLFLFFSTTDATRV